MSHLGAVLTATKWATNAELIEDVERFGYLDGRVLDCTYGYGTFWKNWKPDDLTACDIDPAKSPIGHSVDFTNLVEFGKRSFDAVVFDPPYKLNGTPTDAVDERYGVHKVATWQDRYSLIIDGPQPGGRRQVHAQSNYSTLLVFRKKAVK